MKSYEDLTNFNNGNVTVLKYVKQDHAKKALWQARCNHCQKVWVLRGGNIKSGRTKSCGCQRAVSVHKAIGCGVGDMTGAFWCRLRHNAEARRHALNITKEEAYDLYQKQKGICALSGLPIGFKDKTASLDRIDSQKPYDLTNIQWVHKYVNKMKNNLNQDVFLSFVNNIYNFRELASFKSSR
jgi:hypothetical protein